MVAIPFRRIRIQTEANADHPSHQKHSNAGAYRDSRARCTTSLRETFRLFSPWLEVGGGFLILIENEKGGGAVWKGKTAYFGRKRELSVAHLLVDLREVYSRSTTCIPSRVFIAEFV